MDAKRAIFFAEKADHMPRYQHIARRLKTAIEQESSRPGTRLPSSRTMGAGRAFLSRHGGKILTRLVAQGCVSDGGGQARL